MAMKRTPDTPAPALSLPLVGGGTWTLAERKPAHCGMVVFYRGRHCPICKGYLGARNGQMAAWTEAGVDVVDCSMDAQDRAEKAVADTGLSALPVAHGLTEASARAWGLWMTRAIRDTEPPVFGEPGLFWVRPDGRLYLIDISSMPMARPDLAFLLGRAPFVIQNAYPARGGYGG
jgi:peroxiredoxin